MNFIRRFATSNKWNVGFIENSLEEILDGKTPLNIKWMKHNCKHSWFADPFILSADENYIYVLVEEFYDPINRGRISKLTIDNESYVLKRIDVVLELPSHLSFPAIKRVGEKVYIYPENSASGKLILYEYDSVSNHCEPVEVLCDSPLTDAILTDVFGEERIYSTQLPTPNKNVLGLYQKQGLVSKYMFKTNTARNAGDWFTFENCIYRPAQDCSKTYGGAVIIQKVIENGGNLSFVDVRRIESNNEIFNQGLHTFNYAYGISIVDAKGFRHPLFKRFFEFVRRAFGRG